MRTLFFAVLALALEASAADVSLSPSSKTVNAGETFAVTLWGTGFDAGLAGGGLNLKFDPGELEVVDVVISDTWDAIAMPGDIDPGAGTITGTQFAVFQNAPPTDRFAILEYWLIARTTGSSLLQLSLFQDNPFTSASGAPVEVSLGGGEVIVVPEPAAAWLLIAGLAVLILVRIRAA